MFIRKALTLLHSFTIKTIKSYEFTWHSQDNCW